MSGSFTVGEGKMFFSAKLKEEEQKAPEDVTNETDENEGLCVTIGLQPSSEPDFASFP